MKKFTLFLCLAACWACKPAAPAETQPEPEIAAVDVPPTAVPFSGSWLNETYYHAVVNKKSPRAAQELVEECYIHIPGTAAAIVRMGYGFHEIGPELRLVQQDGKYTLWEIQGDTLNKVAFAIDQPDPQHLQLNEHRFVKVNVNHVQSLPLILEEILFKGKYKDAKGNRVEFKNTGEVTGMSPYTNYHVRTDYMDAGLQIDQVEFKAEGGKQESFGFKFKGNTLQIYEIKCLKFDKAENRCVNVDFGKVKYVLTKDQ